MKFFFIGAIVSFSLMAFAFTPKKPASEDKHLYYTDTIPKKRDTTRKPWPDTTRPDTPPSLQYILLK